MSVPTSFWKRLGLWPKLAFVALTYPATMWFCLRFGERHFFWMWVVVLLQGGTVLAMGFSQQHKVAWWKKGK